YDLADYTLDQYHSPQYNAEATRFLDSALLLLPPESFEYAYYNGLKYVRTGNNDKSLTYFRPLLQDARLSLHEVALTTSTMSDIYIKRNQVDTAIHLLATAAMADIKSSTKETSAIFNLSSILFKKGDLKNASTYIEKAVEDALFYGARQRKVQMSAILPLIEAEKIARVEQEKKTVTTYAIIVTFLLLLLVYLVIVIARQIRKLKKAQQAITEAHIQQRAINTRLIEANKIKEEYIGFFFNANTAFYDKIERFKAKVEQKITDRKLDDIRFLLNSLSIRQEREELLKNFDSIFLKLFPHFIPEYNALFRTEDITPLKENEVLNTDLRIFALIRLGIHDNDKIAHILGYSVNTINTYKTRIKNKSLLANEDFEAKIMEIYSV
ncbi:MAG TPA: DUF6377 domain-containing protein, partial [Chitinophagaceae bacterium]|nr:DUF6377 domain-containing protein [Chitinophagaceae bacterium]